MKEHIASLPPADQPKRKHIFCIRLTDAEREEIEVLAKRLNIPDSRMARHFVLEAVAFHNQQHEREPVFEA